MKRFAIISASKLLTLRLNRNNEWHKNGHTYPVDTIDVRHPKLLLRLIRN